MPGRSRDEIRSVVSKNIQSIIEGAKGRQITDSDSMRDFGADSLEVVEVVSRTMRELGVKVPRTDLAEAKNVGDLVTLLEKADKSGGQAKA